MHPVQQKLFSTVFWEKESGKDGVFNAVQILKNISGKNLFRIAPLVLYTSHLFVQQPATVKRGIRDPGFILIRSFDQPFFSLTHQLHLAPRPPPLIDFPRKSSPYLSLRAQINKIA